ncbi:unnamed protein product [Closterium sp. NIES-53]
MLLYPLLFFSGTDSGSQRNGGYFTSPLQSPLRPPLRTQECSRLAQAGSERAIGAMERWDRISRTSTAGFPARDGCTVEYTSAAGPPSATGPPNLKHSKCAIEWVTKSKGPESGGTAPFKCSENLHRLVDSCHMNDIPITIFGLHPSTTPPPPPPGSPEPSWMNLLFKYLHVVPPDRIVAVSSSNNVVMLPSRHCEQQHLLESFLSLQSPVVFAANDRCAPSPSSSSSSASSTSSFFYKPHSADGVPNRFLNPGMFIGYAWALQRVLEVVVGSTQGHGSSGHTASASASAAAAAAAAGPAGAHADAQRQLLLAFLAQDIFSSLPRLPMDFPFVNVTGTSKAGGDPAVGSGAVDGAGGKVEGQDAMAPPVTFASTALDNRFLPSDPSSSSLSPSASSSAAAGAAVCAAFPAHPTAPSSSRPFISLDHQNLLFQVLGARGAAAPGGKEVEMVASVEDVRVKAEGTGGEACAFQQEDWVGGGGEGAELGVVRLVKEVGIDQLRKERGYIA